MSKTLNAQSPPPISMAANKSTRTCQRSASETSRRIMSQHPQEQYAPAYDNLFSALDAALDRQVLTGGLLHGYRSTLKAQLASWSGPRLCKQDRLFTEKQNGRTLDRQLCVWFDCNCRGP